MLEHQRIYGVDYEQKTVQFNSGELRLYVDGSFKASHLFDSKKERLKKMSEWAADYKDFNKIEIGVILDYEP